VILNYESFLSNISLPKMDLRIEIVMLKLVWKFNIWTFRAKIFHCKKSSIQMYGKNKIFKML
jgi:hypothetical protein